MIERVNFLEKGKYVLTYKRMLQYGALWVLFLAFIFLLLSGYAWFQTKRVEKANSFLGKLNAKKKQTEALVEASKFKHVSSSIRELSNIYANFPLWSKVMSDLSRSMPRQMWLNTVNTSYIAESSMYRKIDISGYGLSTASISLFIEMLNKKPLFRNIVLSETKRLHDESRQGYTFVATGQIQFGRRQWK